MLSPDDQRFVYHHAYVAEHLPDYVQAVSGAEPTLHENYLCYVRAEHLIFVGYPLGHECTDVEQAYVSACKRFRPATVAIIAPSISFHGNELIESMEDVYYKLDLPLTSVPPAAAYMIRRASRELRVCEGSYGKDHERLVADFLAARAVGPSHEEIFRRIPAYLKQSRTASLVEGWKGDQLIVFSILDLGSATYGFYMFSFRSLTAGIPGASDALVYEMTRMAEASRKSAINLGLGINQGVMHFKKKWGAVPLLPYASALIRKRAKSLLSVLARLGLDC